MDKWPLQEVWNLLEQKIFSLPSTDKLFNPYNDVDLDVDLPDAHLIRRNNLKNYLRSFSAVPRIVLIGEAPGPWGCRFSGVPFTSEAQLRAGTLPFSGCQTSKRDRPYTESSATIFWETLRPYQPHFFQWNCIPLQPHHRSEPLSIRSPMIREIEQYGNVLLALLSLLQPKCIVAIGRKAQIALARIGVEAAYVRHPSHGGAKAFRIGIDRIFSAQGERRLAPPSISSTFSLTLHPPLASSPARPTCLQCRQHSIQGGTEHVARQAISNHQSIADTRTCCDHRRLG